MSSSKYTSVNLFRSCLHYPMIIVLWDIFRVAFSQGARGNLEANPRKKDHARE